MKQSGQPEEPDLEYVDEDAEIERRRRRREAILAKTSSATTPLSAHASKFQESVPRALNKDVLTRASKSPSGGM